ncbi:MAG: hypothetical protein ACI9XK_003656 [Granulosicoccus sp.]|jgi:hypothetical protein
MDGKQRRLSTGKIVGITLFVLSGVAQSAEEPLDPEFLEWLGQMAEVEELGVDIEQFLLSREQASEDEEAEEKSQ